MVAQGAAGCNIQLEEHVLSCFGTKDPVLVIFWLHTYILNEESQRLTPTCVTTFDILSLFDFGSIAWEHS